MTSTKQSRRVARPQLRPTLSRWLLTLFLLWAFSAAANAQFNFTTNNGVITITKYTGSGGNLTIPDSINGLPVTRIEGLTFWNSYNVTGITMGNNVTSIGNFAFHNCTGLTNVSIGTNVTIIEKNAFAMTGLSSVVIPDSVTSLGDYMFASCKNLSRVKIGDGVTNIGAETFYICTELSGVTIGSNVTSIGNKAFYSCTNLASIIIPNSVHGVGHFVFAHCQNLTNVVIGSNVANIGIHAFSYSRLKGAYFSGNAPVADPTAFTGDTNVTVYYLPHATGWGATFGGRPTSLWNP